MSVWVAALLVGTALPACSEDVLEQLKEKVTERAKVVLARESLIRQREADRLTLRSSIDGFRAEADRLRELIAAEREALKKARKQYDERSGDAEGLKAEVVGYEERLSGWDARVEALKPSLPPKLRRRLEEVAAGEAEVSDATSLRQHRLVLALRTIEEFNQRLVVDSELWESRDGDRKAVRIVYLGLAQAYYQAVGGGAGGIGSAVDGVWSWRPQDGIGPRVEELLKVHRRETDIDFVSLPATVKKEKP